MTLKLKIFKFERQSSNFNDIETSTLNWIDDSTSDDEFDNIFVMKYGSFLIDDEHEYDMFQFDDLCPASECLISFVFEFDSPPTLLELKPLLNSLKYSFLGASKE